MGRYWRIHFTNDPYDYWFRFDFGQPVTEKRAVALAQMECPTRGAVTAAIRDYR